MSGDGSTSVEVAEVSLGQPAIRSVDKDLRLEEVNIRIHDDMRTEPVGINTPDYASPIGNIEPSNLIEKNYAEAFDYLMKRASYFKSDEGFSTFSHLGSLLKEGLTTPELFEQATKISPLLEEAEFREEMKLIYQRKWCYLRKLFNLYGFPERGNELPLEDDLKKYEPYFALVWISQKAHESQVAKVNNCTLSELKRRLIESSQLMLNQALAENNVIVDGDNKLGVNEDSIWFLPKIADADLKTGLFGIQIYDTSRLDFNIELKNALNLPSKFMHEAVHDGIRYAEKPETHPNLEDYYPYSKGMKFPSYEEALASSFQAILLQKGRLKNHEKLVIGYTSARTIFVENVLNPISKSKDQTPEKYLLSLMLDSVYNHDPFEIIEKDLKDANVSQNLDQLMTGYDDITIMVNKKAGN